MTDHDSLTAAITYQNRILESQAKILEAQGKQLVDIAESLIGLKLQGKDITVLEKSLEKLWALHDAFFGPDGTITSIKTYQAACPAKGFKKSIDQLWAAIGLVVTLILGLKFLG